MICKLSKEATLGSLGHDSVGERADSLISSGITMAELLSPQRLSDIRAFEREWIALRECVSPRTDKQQQYLTAIDWRRLLLLAREHDVLDRKSTRLNSSH